MTTDNNPIPCRCGAIPSIVGSFDFGYKVACVRDECNDFAAGTWATGNTEDEAIAAWNRRASPTTAPVAETIAAAEAAARQGRDALASWWAKATREERLVIIDGARHLLSLLGGSEPATAPAGWLPIETAPKDGTGVLIWDEDTAWIATWTRGFDNIRKEHWEAFVCDGFRKHFGAVAWMPLPTAPGAAPVSAPVAQPGLLDVRPNIGAVDAEPSLRRMVRLYYAMRIDDEALVDRYTADYLAALEGVQAQPSQDVTAPDLMDLARQAAWAYGLRTGDAKGEDIPEDYWLSLSAYERVGFADAVGAVLAAARAVPAPVADEVVEALTEIKRLATEEDVLESAVVQIAAKADAALRAGQAQGEGEQP